MKRSLWLPSITVLLGLAAGPAALAIDLPPADAGWVRLDGDHLTLLSDTGESAARATWDDLTLFRAALRKGLGGLDSASSTPTCVFVFGDRDAYRGYTPRRPVLGLNPSGVGPRPVVGTMPEEVGGTYHMTRDGGFLLVGPAAESGSRRILYHEYVHHFLASNFTDVPVWFAEGLAECYGTFAIEGDSARVGAGIDDYRRWLKRRRWIAPADLMAVDAASAIYQRADSSVTVHAESWALVHYLLWGPDRGPGSGLGRLADLHPGGSLRDAVRPLIGDDPMALQGALQRYVKKGRFASSLIPLGDSGHGDRPAVHHMPRDEVLYRLGDYLLRTDPARAADARLHLGEAVRLNPANGPAQVDLGEIASLEGATADADDRLTTAFALEPGGLMTADQYLDRLVALAEMVAGAWSRDGEREKVQAVADRLATLRSEPAARKAAAGIVFRADLSDAKALLANGDSVRAGARLLALRNAAPTSTLRAQVDALLAGAYGRSTPDLPASLYDKAASRLAAGDFAGATELFQQVIDQSPDPELVREAREGLKRVAMKAAQMREMEQRLERYDGAAEFYAAGDLRAAGALLRRLIEENADDFIAAQAKELLAKIDAAPGPPR